MKLMGCSNTYLPVEIIEQIILLLPLKSIGRWRSVSKQWRGLLSSPQFIKAHATIMQAQSVSIFAYTSWMRFSLTNDNQVTASVGCHHLCTPRLRTCIMGSCNGLVLVLENACQSFLINPTTRQTREIPNIITCRIVYPMNPFTTTRITLDGIGFDSVRNDYKVVSVSQVYNRKVDDSSHKMFVHIYSVNAGAWKDRISLTNFFGYRFYALRLRGVFVGRCIHWLIRRDTDDIVVIVAFDVVEEKLCQMPIPTHHSFKYMPHQYRYGLGVLAGCLYVSTMTEGYLNVWVMNKYGIKESWTRIVRIERTEKVRLVCAVVFGRSTEIGT